MGTKGDSISVTHFVNPHLFWFHKVDVLGESHKKIKELEDALAKKYQPAAVHLRQRMHLEFKELVAAWYLPWNKYIRALVFKAVEDDFEYILWAMDYGFPFVSKSQCVQKLSKDDRFKVSIDHIYRGGVANIVPAENEYDIFQGKLVLKVNDKWCERACKFLQKNIDDNVLLSFEKHFEDKNGHLWGNLMFVDRKQRYCNVAGLLKDQLCAVECEKNFDVACLSFKWTKAWPYFNNNGKFQVRPNLYVTNYTDVKRVDDDVYAIKEREYAERKVEDWYERNERILQLNNTKRMESENCNALESAKNSSRSLTVSSSVQYDKRHADLSEDAIFDLDDSRNFYSTPRQRGQSNVSPPKIEKEETPFVPAASNTNAVTNKRILKLLAHRRKMEQVENKRSSSITTGITDAAKMSSTSNVDAIECISNADALINKIDELSLNGKKKTDVIQESQLSNFYANYVELPDVSKSINDKKKDTNGDFLEELLYKRNTSVSAKSIERLKIKRKELLTNSASSECSEHEKPISTNKFREAIIKDAQNVMMIPAGYDMTNLQKYNDEKNHWHVKKELREHEYNKIEDCFETSVNTENSSLNNEMTDVNSMGKKADDISPYGTDDQNFRHTRAHNDKYKNPVMVKQQCASLEKCTDEKNHCNVKKEQRENDYNKIDDSVKTSSKADNNSLNNEIADVSYMGKKADDISIDATDDQNFRHTRANTDKHKNTVMVEKQLSDLNRVKLEQNIKSNTDANIINSIVLPKRKQLTPPALQKDKINKILQNAQNEKSLGNNSILDLRNSHDNCTLEHNIIVKADINSSLDSTSLSNSDFDTARRKTSNKSALSKKPLESNDKSENNFSQSKNEFPILKKCSTNLIFKKEPLKLEVSNLNVLNQYRKDLGNKVMVHAGESVMLDLVENIYEVHFPQKEIVDQMEYMNINTVYRIQGYSWTHILRGNSVFVVNPVRSGKTWSYLPSICSLVCLRIQNCQAPNTYGPLAIIMVPSSTHAEHVSKHCQRLLTKCNVEVVTLFGVKNANNAKIKLLEGCGILVTTPASLLRLLDDDDRFINSRRLYHLVLDDVELMLSHSEKEFSAAVKTIMNMSKHCKEHTLQLVVTSREWKPELLSLIKRSCQPLLLIGDFLEAAVYSKTAITIKLSGSGKISQILQFIEDHPSEVNRLVIFCNSASEADKIEEALKKSNRLCISGVCSNQDQLNSIKDVLSKWPEGLIFVCVDEVLPELNIQNANNIIHYSMPETWTIFTKRFSAMAQCYENRVTENPTLVSIQKPTSLILLDKHNSEQLPRLYDFLKKHNQLKIISSDILAVIENIKMQREVVRIHNCIPLCPFLLEFGDCVEVSCFYRHNITHFDAIKPSDNIPQSGELRLLILKAFTPTHYSARLLQHKPENSAGWNEICNSSKAASFIMKLNLHYKRLESCVSQCSLKVNDLCVCKVDDIYQRARIMQIDDVKNFIVERAINVTVKLIDLGEIKKIHSNELLVCDEQFRDFAPQAIDIRIKGVLPFDNERTWDSLATKSVDKWIKQKVVNDMCVQIDINFAFAQTIWANNAIVLKYLPEFKRYTYHLNLRRYLIENNFGTVTTDDKFYVRDYAEKLNLFQMNSSNSHNEQTMNSSIDSTFKSCSDSKYTTSANSNDSFRSAQGDKDTKPESENTSKRVDKSKVSTTYDEDWDNLSEKPRDDEIYLPLIENFSGEQINDGRDTLNSTNTCNAVKMEDEWIQMPLNRIVKVEIGDEAENGNWSNIYLQCIDDAHQKNFHNLNEIIWHHIANFKNGTCENFSGEHFDVMQNCIIKYDGLYLRAKIVGIFGSRKTECIYQFFLCDYACFVKETKGKLFNDFLYPTTKEIVNFTPFQAVHCRLAGLQLDGFHRQQKVTKSYLFAYAVEKKSNKMPLNITSYNILLYECDNEEDFASAQMLNRLLVNSNVADIDPETKHFLELDVGVDTSNNDINNIEIQTPNGEVVSFDELLQCFQKAYEIELKEFEKEAKRDHKIQKVLQETEDMNATTMMKREEQIQNMNKLSTNKSENIKEREKTFENTLNVQRKDFVLYDIEGNECTRAIEVLNNDNLPQLHTLQKRPQTTWHQTDCVINMIIHAPDITNYYLKVTSDALHFAAYVNEEYQQLILNFFGTVDSSCVSHEVRGLNVIVRLIKGIYAMWPRLLQESTKFNWLTYDLSGIDRSEANNMLLPQQELLKNICSNEHGVCRNSSDSDDSDDEVEFFENYAPIVNSDDIRDPTTDLY